MSTSDPSAVLSDADIFKYVGDWATFASRNDGNPQSRPSLCVGSCECRAITWAPSAGRGKDRRPRSIRPHAHGNRDRISSHAGSRGQSHWKQAWVGGYRD